MRVRHVVAETLRHEGVSAQRDVVTRMPCMTQTPILLWIQETETLSDNLTKYEII